ncbi:hypothetical protein QBC46DRAFT_370705 [Diplogelasinospora grovesii]|uniref:Phospholipase/carboxylesterase/thioesterase domain-containing protein n=1 Tax=Diplogelasinospora grovesii TaxID=303347 RepID=A0AAN6SAI2_9PEZI|nr:hypothetical protein QBC46DRAFT_370705 [Diplogelasinospora grovesii]
MPTPTRIPTESDFAPLTQRGLVVSLCYPSPRESTTAILILFHGLGDSEIPFADFARRMSLPGVLGISVRGTSIVPAALIGDGARGGEHYHWGDDLRASSYTDGLDMDPGYTKAADLVLNHLIRGVLVDTCGWTTKDILLFGFGQGGSFALGLGSLLRVPPKVVEIKEEEDDKGNGQEGGDQGVSDDEGSNTQFMGIVSIGGPLPPSMIPTVSGKKKSRTPVLVCRGRASEVLDDEGDAIDTIKEEFQFVKVVTWKKRDDGMPTSRDDMVSLMKFFADALSSQRWTPETPTGDAFKKKR